VKVNDAVPGALLIALGAAVLAGVQGFPKIPGQPVGPALFPGIIAVGLCVCGAILVVKGWLARREGAWFTADDWVRSPRHALALAVLLGGIVFYILLAERLGFFITATLVLFALLASLRLAPLRAFGIALVAVLLIHFAFYKLLRVPLPWGVLKNHAW
jgi:putative tricarboxylic transport membrane protein